MSKLLDLMLASSSVPANGDGVEASAGNSSVGSLILTPSSAVGNPLFIREDFTFMENSWDFTTELIFIVILSILTIPANIFLIVFYIQKVRRYKRLKHLNARYARVANSFHTYLIEMCAFDTIIVIYLLLDTTFQFLYSQKKSQYESVFDISNFTCKFFIYMLRISSAMSNILVFLLALNRSMLVLFKAKPKRPEPPKKPDAMRKPSALRVPGALGVTMAPQQAIAAALMAGSSSSSASSHRICLNTKYLTLFLFCVCTIANVFRLELLNINARNESHPHALATKFLSKNSMLLEMFNLSSHKFFPQTQAKLDEMNLGGYDYGGSSDGLDKNSSFDHLLAFENSFAGAKAYSSEYARQSRRRRAIRLSLHAKTVNALKGDKAANKEEATDSPADVGSQVSVQPLSTMYQTTTPPISPDQPSASFISQQTLLQQQFIQNLQNLIPSTSHCGPNVGSISFTKSDSTNALFWSLIIYNCIFVISPAVGNLILSVYLIRKRAELVIRLMWLTDNLINAKLRASCRRSKKNYGPRRRPPKTAAETEEILNKNEKSSSTDNNLNESNTNMDEIINLDASECDDSRKILINNNDNPATPSTKRPSLNSSTSTANHFKRGATFSEFQKYRLNELHAEFLKTCTPCIAFSLTHVILFLPYSIIDLTNQIMPDMHLFNILQYMTYVRYLFYCSKFYLLFLVSYRFRRDFVKFFRKEESSEADTKSERMFKQTTQMGNGK